MVDLETLIRRRLRRAEELIDIGYTPVYTAIT
jgi:hypothetical protein